MFWKSKKEEKVTKPVEKVEPKVEPKPEPKRPSFYEVVSNHLYMRTSGQRWGSVNGIDNISGGVRISLDVNPAYLFPQPLRTNVGTLVIGEYRSNVSHISVSFSVENSDDYGYYRDYNARNRYDGYYDDRYVSNGRHRGYGPDGLSIDRQVYLNSDHDFVTQNNELILSEQSVRINIPFRSNIRISNVYELDSRILSVLDEVKKTIVENFQREIIKSKSEIVQKEFKKNITTQLVTDTFQHVIDLVRDSEVGEYKDAVSAVLFVPIKISSEKDRMSLDLDKKTIDIFYELMEGANRIKGEYDVLTTLNFIGGIQLVISPKPIDLESVKIDGEKERERKQYEQMMRNSLLNREMVISDPYRDLDIAWE
jgi:hypothetical protein